MIHSIFRKQEFQYIVLYIRKRTSMILDGINTDFASGQLIIIESDKLAFRTDVKGIAIPARTLHEHLLLSAQITNKTALHIRTKNYISVSIPEDKHIDKILDLYHMADTKEQKKICIHFILCFFHKQKDFIPFCLSHLSYCRKTRIVISSDIKRNWLLSDVASFLCMSPSTLKKKLNEEGHTFSSILTKCRMKFASELLLLSNKKVNQVALECGYKNVSYFITVFSRFYGIRPGHYALYHNMVRNSTSDSLNDLC